MACHCRTGTFPAARCRAVKRSSWPRGTAVALSLTRFHAEEVDPLDVRSASHCRFCRLGPDREQLPVCLGYNRVLLRYKNRAAARELLRRSHRRDGAAEGCTGDPAGDRAGEGRNQDVAGLHRWQGVRGPEQDLPVHQRQGARRRRSDRRLLQPRGAAGGAGERRTGRVRRAAPTTRPKRTATAPHSPGEKGSATEGGGMAEPSETLVGNRGGSGVFGHFARTAAGARRSAAPASCCRHTDTCLSRSSVVRRCGGQTRRFETPRAAERVHRCPVGRPCRSSLLAPIGPRCGSSRWGSPNRVEPLPAAPLMPHCAPSASKRHRLIQQWRHSDGFNYSFSRPRNRLTDRTTTAGRVRLP